MRITILILISILFCIHSQGQTKKERIKFYRENSEEYLPKDLRDYKVLVIQLTNEEIIKRFRDAHYRSYAENGIDTLTNPNPFLDSELQHFKKADEKNKSLILIRDKKLKKVLNPTYIKTSDIRDFNHKSYRYLMEVDFISNKGSPESLGFVISYDYYFIDRLTGKKYKVIHELKFSVVDLIVDVIANHPTKTND